MRVSTHHADTSLLQAALVVFGTALLYSCSMQEEEIVKETPLRLTKAIKSPGKYAYHAFYSGPFGNTIEVFDLESKESIGTIIPDEQKKIVTLAVSPSQPRGLVTLLEIPGKVYLFDLRNSSWRETTVQRNPMGVAVFTVNEDRCWIEKVGTPELLELDVDSGNIVAHINLSTYFERLLPHIALSPNGAYLAVLGTSPSDSNYFRNGSLVIWAVRNRAVQSVIPLDAIPGYPVFTSDGRSLCILDLSRHDNILVVEIESGKSTAIPFVWDSLDKPQIGLFSIAVDPTRDVLIASLADPAPESFGPLNTLAVFDLQNKKMEAPRMIGVKASHLCYEPDGRILYTITPDGMAALDGDTFAVLYEIKSSLLNSSQGDRRNPRNYMPGKLALQVLK